MTLPQDDRAPFRQQRWVELYNDSQQALTAYSVVEVTSASRPESGTALTPGGGRTVLHVQPATEDSPRDTCIVGPKDIAVGEYGPGTMSFPAYAQYTGGTPVNGQEWGVASGGTQLVSGQTGFIILGDPNGTTVRVMRDSGGNRNTEFLCYLAANMCPTDDATLTGPYEPLEYPDSRTPVAAFNANFLQLAGHSGAMVHIKWRYQTNTWFVENVEHVEHDVAVEDDTNVFIKYDGNECEILGHVRNRSAIMSCSTEEWKTQISMYQRNLVADMEVTGGFPASGAAEQETCPILKEKKTSVCLFDADDDLEATTLLAFEEIQVVVDFRDDGECVYAQYQAVCVADIEDAETEEPIICGVDCIDESGSGA